jgi:hypothetical protein
MATINRYCLWCGRALNTPDRRRRYCCPQHMIAHQNAKYRVEIHNRWWNWGVPITNAQYRLVAKKYRNV